MKPPKARENYDSKLLDLMKEMGAKSFDPIPPDQYLYFLTSDDEEQRYLAYIRQRTIGFPSRSAFAVEPDARPTSNADVARACFNGHQSNAAVVGERLAAKGLISFAKKPGRIYLRGEVLMPPRQERRESEENYCVYSSFPSYLQESIDSLKSEDKAKVLSAFESFAKCENRAIADAVTTIRIKFSQAKDNMCAKFGLPIKRLDRKHRPDLHEGRSQCVQLSLLLPDDLQQFAESVQTPECTNHKNGSEHTENGSRIIIDKNKEETTPSSSSPGGSVHRERTTTTNGAPTPEFHTEHVAVWERAGKDGIPTWKQSQDVLRRLGSRAHEFLEWISPQKLNRVQHPGALPKLVEEFLQTSPAPAAAPAGPVCWKCGRSLEKYGSVDGACFACMTVAEAAGQ